MKCEPQSLTVHLRPAAHRIRKLFFSDSMALEDKTTVLRRNLSTTDRQQAIRTGRFGAEIEKLGEMARRSRAKLENCYVKIKLYTVSVAADEPISEWLVVYSRQAAESVGRTMEGKRDSR